MFADTDFALSSKTTWPGSCNRISNVQFSLQFYAICFPFCRMLDQRMDDPKHVTHEDLFDHNKHNEKPVGSLLLNR